MSEDFVQAARTLTPEVYQSLRRAVETGRWPDGRELSTEQRRLCMEAIITWEAVHLPEEQRTGYMPPVDCESDRAKEAPQAVTLRPARGDSDA